MSPTQPNLYRLDISRHSLLVLVLLLCFTAALLFYLGMVTGLAKREANPSNTPPRNITSRDASTVPKPSTLAFNSALQPGKDTIEPLFTQRAASFQQTQKLLQQANQLLGMQTTDSTYRIPTSTVTSQTPPPISDLPKAALLSPIRTTSAENKTTLYTLQVFSSTKLQSAQQLKNKLREQGFNAYLEKSILGKKTWHRVRVGKLPKKQAQELIPQLKQRDLQPQLLKIP